MRFGNFTDTGGEALPDDILKIEEIPPQIGSDKIAAAITQLGETILASMATIMASSMALNMNAAGSFS